MRQSMFYIIVAGDDMESILLDLEKGIFIDE